MEGLIQRRVLRVEHTFMIPEQINVEHLEKTIKRFFQELHDRRS